MHRLTKNRILAKLAMAVWALFTLLLFFVVVLLANEMLKGGGDPLTAFLPIPEAEVEEAPREYRSVGTMGTQDILLYFAAADGRSLAAETLVIELSPRTVENCRKALQRLIAGPRQDHLNAVLPEQTRIRALYLLENGELVVDLATELLLSPQRPRSAEMEALMAYGIVNTVTQPALKGEGEPDIRSVRFLFDGVPPQEQFPAHLDLHAPLLQDRRWIQAGME